MVETCIGRDDPLVVRFTPPGKKRGVKYDHLLYPEGEERPAPEPEAASTKEFRTVQADVEPALRKARQPVSSGEITELLEEVAELREQVARLAERVGFLEASGGG